MKFPTSRRRRLLLCALAAILFLFVGIFFLQSAVAHRKPPFLPDYPIIDLSPIWEQPRLDAEDYDTLFLQTRLPRHSHLYGVEAAGGLLDKLIIDGVLYKDTGTGIQESIFEWSN